MNVEDSFLSLLSLGSSSKKLRFPKKMQREIVRTHDITAYAGVFDFELSNIRSLRLEKSEKTEGETHSLQSSILTNKTSGWGGDGHKMPA